ALGHCSVSAGGVKPIGISTYISLTTAPLGGAVFASAPASHSVLAPLEGGRSQKNLCEYSSWTVLPPSHASVYPMFMQFAPPLRQGSAVCVPAPASPTPMNAVVTRTNPTRASVRFRPGRRSWIDLTGPPPSVGRG